MPEDANRKGARATQRIVSLFEGFGWNLKSRTDVDVIVDTSDSDRTHNYGIDAFLTYDDPYSPHVRGNLIESKSWAWQSVTESKVEDFFETLLEKVDKAPESEYFEQTHNLGNEATITNTGIVALWATDGFDSSAFREYVRSLDAPRKWELAKICIWGNETLRQLASFEDQYRELKNYHDDLKIYYPDLTDEDGGRYDLVTFEYLLSDFMFATGGESAELGVVFYFDKVDFDSLLFMYKSLRHYQLLSNHDKLHVYVPRRSHETEPVEDEFLRTFSGEDSDTDIEFKTLRQVSDLSHLDNR